jgi:hypothetical protein
MVAGSAANQADGSGSDGTTGGPEGLTPTMAMHGLLASLILGVPMHGLDSGHDADQSGHDDDEDEDEEEDDENEQV